MQEASTLEHFTFHGDLTGHFSSTALGVGLPPTPAPDGTLPAIWELQQASLWPPVMAAQRCSRLEQCLQSFTDASVAATKAAITSHLHASIQALLKSDRGAGGAVAPPQSAPMEDLLQWLRPAAFLALLQSLALLLRVVHWFFEGCGVLMDAALSAVQVCHHVPQMCWACTAVKCCLEPKSHPYMQEIAKILQNTCCTGDSRGAGCHQSGKPTHPAADSGHVSASLGVAVGVDVCI